MIYCVNVESSTHDDLRAGQTCAERTWVEVEADNECEAMLIAAQMAAGRGMIPTQTTPEY